MTPLLVRQFQYTGSAAPGRNASVNERAVVVEDTLVNTRVSARHWSNEPRKKQKRRKRLLAIDAFCFFLRSFCTEVLWSKGLRQFHVHGRAADFVSRKISAESNFRSAPESTEVNSFYVPKDMCH